MFVLAPAHVRDVVVACVCVALGSSIVIIIIIIVAAVVVIGLVHGLLSGAPGMDAVGVIVATIL